MSYAGVYLINKGDSVINDDVPVADITGSVIDNSTIGQDQMNNQQQATNALDAIRGRVAGLTIEENSGNALSAVRLRGTVSLTGGNNPLIIVDGVLGDISLLQSVYPTDIESFTILKDASQTAQYGSRGAAGVIMINTLKGQKGRLRISYNGSAQVSNVYKTLNMLDANLYRSFTKANGISIIDGGADTDFQKQILRLGWNTRHHIALSGGTERSDYHVSVGYQEDQSVVRNIGSRTFISNMNLTHKMFKDILQIDVGMFGTVNKESIINDQQKLFYSAASWNPTFAPDATIGYPTASQINNPLALLQTQNKPENAHISTHGKLRFNIIPTLHLDIFGSYSYDIRQDKIFLPTSIESGGKAIRSTNQSENILTNISLNYDKTWFNGNRLKFTGLAELQIDKNDGYYTTVTSFNTNLLGYDNLSAGALRPWNGTNSYYYGSQMVSFLASVSYSYKGRYNIDVAARTDASSKFSAANRWGLFPSISAKWVISNEEWLKYNPVLDYLEINAGYGISGNQASIDNYLTLDLFQPGSIAAAGNKNTVTFSKAFNPNSDLKWEVSKTANAGIDLRLFNNRLIFNASYYYTLITDMLYTYQVSTPPFVYPQIVANIGSMRNQGVEVSLGGVLVKTKDTELNINANLTWQQNRLLSLNGKYNDTYLTSPEYTAIGSLSGAGSHGGNNTIVYQIVGEPLGTFYLPQCTGLVEDENGHYTYAIKDIDNDGITDISDGYDRYIAGQATPKFLLGTNIGFRYKNLDISMQLNGAFGHKIYNGTSLAYMNLNSLPEYNVLIEALDAKIYDQTATDYWLKSGNYLNIDYITLGYTIPFLHNEMIENIRIALTMNNVATLTAYNGLTPMINNSNIDPTIGIDDKRTIPPCHTYSLGLTVNF